MGYSNDTTLICVLLAIEPSTGIDYYLRIVAKFEKQKTT